MGIRSQGFFHREVGKEFVKSRYEQFGLATVTGISNRGPKFFRVRQIRVHEEVATRKRDDRGALRLQAEEGLKWGLFAARPSPSAKIWASCLHDRTKQAI